MGITGLLPLLKSIQVTTHIKQYAGKVVGVDAYVWLHKGAFACAWDLALGNSTTKYVDYAMHRIKMLRHYGVEPYVVFDGDYLPSKLHTEDSRASKRAEHRSAGMRFHAQKQNAKATEQFQKCIDITPEMAYRFILALRKENISYVVAPYEADAQLAYLEKKGIIQAIITEDSDLLVFGCKTLLLKMSQFGDCVEIRRERFANVTGQITFHGWTDDDFRHMAILSGCDYLANINGVGLITAHRLLKRFNKNIQRVVQSLRLQVGTRVPSDYMDSFHRANMTFKHQRVFCPERECLVMWNEPQEPLNDEILVYIGTDVDTEIAQGVAKGDLHPMTKAPLSSQINDKENIKPPTFEPHYKPKPPPSPKSIRAYFSPKRSRSMQDITGFSKQRDSEKANTTPSVKNFFTPKLATMKRSFTAMSGEETIAQKRARKYLGSDEEEVVASPFFGGKRPIVKQVETPTAIASEIMEKMTEAVVEVSELQTQVSESPIRPKEQALDLEMDNEVILDSPTGAIRSGDLLNNSEANLDKNIIEEIHASPGYESPVDDIFPLSPLQSRPTIMPLPTQTLAHTPILRPGMKKAYTPRPSHTILPDTPTPSPILTSQHNIVVQGWKDRFLSASSSPKLSNTISSRPMTPLHTPLLRRTPVTPFIRKQGLSNVNTPTKKSYGSVSSRLAVEQIEEVSPPRGRSVCLDQFRFNPQ